MLSSAFIIPNGYLIPMLCNHFFKLSLFRALRFVNTHAWLKVIYLIRRALINPYRTRTFRERIHLLAGQRLRACPFVIVRISYDCTKSPGLSGQARQWQITLLDFSGSWNLTTPVRHPTYWALLSSFRNFFSHSGQMPWVNSACECSLRYCSTDCQ